MVAIGEVTSQTDRPDDSKTLICGSQHIRER
jgi:hypothetical protein